MFPDAAQEFLVQQRALDGSLAATKQSEKAVEIGFQRLHCRRHRSQLPSTTLKRPKRRGSTKRNSLPEASLAIACVCLSTSSRGSQTCKRPVMPRCTIHCAGVESAREAAVCAEVPGVGPALLSAFAGRGEEDRRSVAAGIPRGTFDFSRFAGTLRVPLRSRSKTICFPTRRTAAMRLRSSTAAISAQRISTAPASRPARRIQSHPR